MIDVQPRPSAPRRKVFWILGVVALLIVALVIGKSLTAKEEKAQQAPRMARAVPVLADDVKLAPVPLLFGSVGTVEAVETFLSATYRVGKEADRMGLRLEGPALRHKATADIPSDGLVTGSIQVPGNGQPILLLNDHQTAGGYAKIATVISADLPRVGRLSPGDALAFRTVTVEEAEDIRRRQEQTIAGWIRAIRPVRPAGGVDLDALYSENLVSGVVDIVNGNGDVLNAENMNGRAP